MNGQGLSRRRNTYTMRQHGTNIYPRNMQFSGDILTHKRKGEVLRVTQFGLAKIVTAP